MARTKLPTSVEHQRYYDLAKARRNQMPHRFVMYAVAFVITLMLVSVPWAIFCMTFVTLAEVFEYDTVRRILARAREPLPRDLTRRLFLANLLTATSAATAISVGWMLTESLDRLFPLSFLFAAALASAMSSQHVYALVMIRQALYVGLGIILTVADGLMVAGLDLEFLSMTLLPVMAFGGFAVMVGHASARGYGNLVVSTVKLAEARQSADRADQSKQAFFATVSHGMRTPLHGILGYAESLQAEDLTPEQHARARIIAESGTSLSTVLSDLLDLMKFETGKMEMVPEAASLHDDVGQVVEFYRPLAEKKHLMLDVDIADETPEWFVHDSARVRQCLGNLISNAIKHTDEGRIAVRVGAEPAEDADGAPCAISIAVTDTGTGIGQEELARLFSPIAEPDEAMLDRTRGIGLGLDITRRLARMMGGDVRCVSQPGQGSKFTLTFTGTPARNPSDAAPEDGTAAPAPPCCIAGAKVLIADDVETNRALARMYLEPLEVRTDEAVDGDEALARLRQERFDAVLLDLWMPGQSGEEIVKAIRSGLAGNPGVPVLAVTADQLADRDSLHAMGFDGVVLKPVRRQGMQDALIDVFRARQARELACPIAS